MTQLPNLSSRLDAWFPCVLSSVVQWVSLPSFDHRFGACIELRIDAYQLFHDDNPMALGQRLRAAMDLVLLTLEAQPSALEPLLRKTKPDDPPSDDDAIKAVLAHRVPTQVRLSLRLGTVQTHRLLPRLPMALFDNQPKNINEGYQVLRKDLLDHITANQPSALERLGKQTVPMTMTIAWSGFDKSMLRMEELLMILTVFTQEIPTAKRDIDATATYPVDSENVPFT